MVGTRAFPNRKLTKEHLQSVKKGNILKHRAKHGEPTRPFPSQEEGATIVPVCGTLPRTPPMTPIINTTGRIKDKMITRRDIPTCLDFGPSRRLMFPGALFCTKCDWWEEELHHKAYFRKMKTRPIKYACTCGHTSFVEPVAHKVDLPSVKPHPLPTAYKNQYDENESFGTDKEDQIDDSSSILSTTSSIESDDKYLSPSDHDKHVDTPILPFAVAPNTTKLLFCQNCCVELSFPKEVEMEKNPEFHATNASPSLSSGIEAKQETSSEQGVEDSRTTPSTLHLEPASNEHTFYKTEITRLLSAVKIQDQRIAAMNKQNSRLKRKLFKLNEKNESEMFKLKCSAKKVTRRIRLYLIRQSKRKDRKQSNVVSHFFKQLLDNNAGEFSNELMNCIEDNLCNAARKSIRTRFLTKHACLRLMDTEGHKISLQVFDLLRRLETGGKKFARNSCLPSSGDIQKAQVLVDRFAQSQVKMHHGYIGENLGDEYIEFDAEELLTVMVKAFGLTDVAKNRSVRINLSIDGAEISKRISHITFGFKVSDVAAKCPITQRPLFLNADTAIMQSRNLCIPVKIIMKKETSEIYSEFYDLFKRFRAISTLWNEATDGPRPQSKWISDGNLPLSLALNMDLSATWKLFGLGGAAKNMTRPCHCCPVVSNNLVKPNSQHCHLWCRDLHDGREGWKCYHHPFLSSEFLEDSVAQFVELKRSLGEVIVAGMSLENPDRTSTNVGINNNNSDHDMRTDEDPSVATANSRLDKHSIHYDVWADTTTVQDQVDYSDLIDRELDKRGLAIEEEANLDERKMLLLASLKQEYKYRQLKEYLSMGERMNASISQFLVLDSVPCILHMENRIGLKFLDRLLTYAISQCKIGTLFLEEFPRSATKRINLLVAQVEEVMNTRILGEAGRAAQWSCPLEGTTVADKRLGTVCLDNNKTRMVVTNFEKLIDICVPQEDLRNKWKQCILYNYVPAYEMLRRKSNFTTEDIAKFQTHIDLWFQQYVELTELAGCTNYIHLLGSGHISKYIRHWGSLYSHSQQGWEAMNALIKLFYFRRTQRGGSAGRNGEGKQSRIVAVGKWLLRRAMWAAGHSYEFMEQQVRDTDRLQSQDDSLLSDGEEENEMMHCNNSSDHNAADGTSGEDSIDSCL